MRHIIHPIALACLAILITSCSTSAHLNRQASTSTLANRLCLDSLASSIQRSSDTHIRIRYIGASAAEASASAGQTSDLTDILAALTLPLSCNLAADEQSREEREQRQHLAELLQSSIARASSHPSPANHPPYIEIDLNTHAEQTDLTESRHVKAEHTEHTEQSSTTAAAEVKSPLQSIADFPWLRASLFLALLYLLLHKARK